MAFSTGSMTQKANNNSGEKSESRFVNPSEDKQVTLRILDKEAFTYYRYWFKVNVGKMNADGNPIMEGRPVIAGYDSPLRAYMKKLEEENASHPRFAKPTRRFVLNVLERVKLDDDEMPTENVEDNVVRIWEFGPQIADQLTLLNGKQRSRRDYKVKLYVNEFDLQLIASGKAMEKRVQVQPAICEDPIPDNLRKLPRYNLAEKYRPFPNEAIQELIDGVDYNDVVKRYGLNEYPTYLPED